MSKTCVQCQAPLEDGDTFCPKCGARQDAETPAASAATTSADSGSKPVATAKDSTDRVIWQGSYSSKAMIGSWITAAIVSLVALVAAGLLSASGAVSGAAWFVAGAVIVVLWTYLGSIFLYRRWSVRYTLMAQRFVHESGLLARRTDRIEVIDIDDVTVKQGPVERVLNVGTIELVSSDRTDPSLILIGIDDVNKVASLIDDARRVERRKHSLHIEQI